MEPDEMRAIEAAWAHRSRLTEYARRILRDADEAEDVVQEVALRARDMREGSLLSWLKAVCYRLAVDRLRARRRRARIERLIAAEPRHDTPIDEERLRMLVTSLAEPYRSAVTLRYLDELEFPEIAARLGTNERTARTWVARGLARLRDRMGGEP